MRTVMWQRGKVLFPVRLFPGIVVCGISDSRTNFKQYFVVDVKQCGPILKRLYEVISAPIPR